MGNIKVALLGFGTVGEGVYQVIQTHQQRLESLLGKKVEVVGILVQDDSKQRAIDKGILLSSDIDQIINIPELEVVVEAIVGVEPGYSYVTKILKKGIHVITANKELLAHKGAELRKIANEYNARLEYEAAVAGGIPVISTLKHLLRLNSVVKIEAILNGTSNYILTDIREKQSSFHEALLLAQQNGYAEADPSNDIDGWDAFYKLMIISDLLFGSQPDWKDIPHKGIRHVEAAHIEAAKSIGYRIKHVATLENINGLIYASIEPILVSKEHALYSVEGVNNSIIITGDVVGELSLQGPGAGSFPTASAIIEDLVNIYKLNDEKLVTDDVSFASKNINQQQEWLMIGPLEPMTNIEIVSEWLVPIGLQSIQCSQVRGSYQEVKEIVDRSQDITGFRINILPISEKEIATV
ncbi:homoserine dehydrogenase [Aquibacillus rhizosphaerae]|uniref:Homoserine dehydrogenase n=1 Tax=Aquibacillus rhizosphaerae TaxID=3051431 RepID=A0ABT7L0E5_9BACI|nr:homoserine dehydrogenase [Aquibacillus sp. LR5S19]MDL4839298.1 homoserine dehydrogenase [Aquibacillus sp. LR5S19]